MSKPKKSSMKFTLSCGFGFEGRNEESFDPSKSSWRISNLEASKRVIMSLNRLGRDFDKTKNLSHRSKHNLTLDEEFVEISS